MNGPSTNWGHPVAYHPMLSHFFESVNAANIASRPSYGQVKYAHCKTIAVGFDSLVNGGTSRNSAKNAAFLILPPVLVARMGGRKPCWLAPAVPSLSTRSSYRPHLTVSALVFKPERSRHLMANSIGASSRQPSRVSELLAAPRTPVSSAKSFCVYALYREGDVVYVGSSAHVSARVAQHISSSKEFDSYSFVNVGSIEEMHELEVRCIAQFSPKYNLGLNSTAKSGFVGMSNLKARYGLKAVAIKKVAQKFKVETLYFRGLAYYSEKEAHVAISSLGGAA